MKEQDNIKDLFSKGLESHTTTVRPEVWSGLQAKMAAAGIASGSAVVAAKGISVLTKWIIGGAAASAIAVTSVILLNNEKEIVKPEQRTESVTAVNTIADNKNEQNTINTENAAEQESTVSNPVSTNNNSVAKPSVNPFLNRSLNSGNSSGAKGLGTETVGGIVNPSGVGVITGSEGTNSPVATPKTGSQTTPKVADDNKIEKLPKTATPAINATETPKAPEAVKSRSKIGTIPNVFTPNNDGKNDIFSVESKYTSDFSVTIMDPKGNPVFRSSDPEFTWDGKSMSGDELPSGSYYCMIVAKGENNEFLKEYKPFQLMR